jgi:hypothetical protein
MEQLQMAAKRHTLARLLIENHFTFSAPSYLRNNLLRSAIGLQTALIFACGKCYFQIIQAVMRRKVTFHEYLCSQIQ